MSQLVLAAFMMGLLGSFHCVGMCGPIALSLPLKHDSDWAKFSGALFYNSGRIITYSCFWFPFWNCRQKRCSLWLSTVAVNYFRRVDYFFYNSS